MFKVVIFLLFGIHLISCQRSNEVTFYLSNGSQYTQKIGIKVFLDESLVLDKSFEYSDNQPNDEIFKFKLHRGHSIIRVVQPTYGLQKVDTIKVGVDNYIFIGFDEFKKELSTGDTITRLLSIHKRKEYTRLY